MDARATPDELGGRDREVIDFSRAEDARMAGQDLFDQARAGARHADHEHRSMRWISATRSDAQRLARKRGANALHLHQSFALVVGDMLPLEAIGEAQMTKRALAIANISIGLYQSEVQRDALVVGKRAFMRGDFFQLDQPRIGLRERLDRGIVELDADVARVDRERGFEVAGGFADLTRD